MRNPLIPGFHPDPSIVRVGDDYYLATSSFEYLPGIPIFHSTELETFDLLTHVAVRDGQLNLTEVTTGGGAWAPTIRHHEGRFWLVVSDMLGGRGTILFTAERPEGPWSDGTVLDVLGIDPDIAWDDEGTCYVTMSGFLLDEEHNLTHLGITQVSLDPDTGSPTSDVRRLWSGTGGMFPEAPHLYHVGDWWYLMIAEGGTERGHSISIARARSPRGPFEPGPNNPLVTARGTDRPVQNTGHGDLVQGPDGAWTVVLLGTRPRSMTRAFAPMGRETFCSPVTWGADGWPSIEPVRLDARHPAIERHMGFPDDRPASLDGFDGEIVAVRQFPAQVADLEARPGWARLTGHGAGMDAPRPDFIGVRQCTEACALEVRLDPRHGVGGLSMRYDETFHYDVEVGGSVVTATMHIASIRQSWTHRRKDTGDVRLRIVADPPATSSFGATCDRLLAQMFDDGAWVTLASFDGRYLSSDVCESFTGRVIGPYARSGHIDVATIDYTGQDIQR